jgi:hypothetical protein
MTRLSTCKFCGKKLTKEEKYTYSSKTCCKDCYDIKLQEKEQYDNLLNQILKYFNLTVPNGMILKQIKEYKDKFEYTYGGMQYCLWYITEIKGIKLELKYGIALVKFEYENAKTYFEQQQSIQNSIVKPVNNEVVHKVKFKVNSNRKEKYLINLDELGGE